MRYYSGKNFITSPFEGAELRNYGGATRHMESSIESFPWVAGGLAEGPVTIRLA